MKIQRTRWLRPLVHLQIVAQIGAALLPFYVGSIHAAEAAVGAESTTIDAHNDKLKQTLAEQLSTFANSAASGNAVGAIAQQVTDGVTKAAEDWLKRFGTARIDLNYTDKFNIDSGAIDLLLPLADSESRLLFTQIGVRKKDAQITGNVGIGQRHFTNDWMFGYNAFYDQNITRGHQRVGIGGEAWRDYLKLSANSYLRISDWKASPDVIDYDERPANGFDLRAEGWLPAMPSLGGKLMYEQYFGNDVGLAGITNRQSNPKAWTLGVNYTPIPMLTVGLDHKRGGGTGDTKIGLQLNYALGESWSKQTDASRVAQRRSVAGSRYDLVERNNHIVLEYRKQQMVKLELPKEIVGKSNKTLALAYTVEAKYGMQRMDWQHAELSAAGGAVNHIGNNQFQITLPAYQAGGNNTYPLSAVATDTKGNSGTASSIVRVNAPDVSVSNSVVTASPTAILADGKSNSIVKIELRDEDNNAIAGMAADLVTPLTETLQSNQVLAPNLPLQPATISALQETSAGIYEAVVTAGTRVGSIAVAPLFRDVALTPVTITEGADAASAHIADGAMTVTVDNSIANQSAANQVRAIVTDAGGNPLAGLPVTFTLSGSAQVAAGSSLTATTDASGAVAVGFTDAVAESVTVNATLANANNAQVTTQFVADAGSAQIGSGDLTVDKTTVIANNTDAATYSAIVKDANGNLVPNISVSWATNLGNLPALSSNTDANGRATISLTGTIAGIAQVTAKVGAPAAVNAPAVTFTADSSSGGIGSGDLTVDKTTVIANNTDAATYSAIVKDANGNVVPNISVSWSTDHGNLSAASSATDTNGRATIGLTGTLVGAAQVTAAVNAPAVNLIADSGSGNIGSGDLTVDKTTVIANNTDAATYSAIVKDANGNVVPNISVNWITDRGNLSATSSTTDANGLATIRLTGAALGAAQVTAQVNAGAAVNAPVVDFIADVATATVTAVASAKARITGTGEETNTVTATVADALGHPVAGATINWTTSLGDLSGATSVTGPTGNATIELSAVSTATSNPTANVTAEINGSTRSSPIQVRAVILAGGRHYWTMQSDHNTTIEATAITNCSIYGNGTVATLADLAAFTAAGADFARMAVAGEYANNWWNLGGTWGTRSGDFHSAGNPVGDMIGSGGTAYVCVR